MKKFLLLFLIFSGMIVFNSISLSANVKEKGNKKIDIKYEKAMIARLLDNYFRACRSKNFALAAKMTTGKQKVYFTKILQQIKRNNGAIPPDVSKYFARLKKFQVEVTEVDESATRAVSIGTYKFIYYDTITRDETRKYRIVEFFLQKVDGQWKIAFSRLKGEEYIIHSKRNKRGKKVIEY